MASGPRVGLAEIMMPARQPRSSIMPGKVNPVMPKVEELRNISEMVVIEVAEVAIAEGVARENLSDNDIKMAVKEAMWKPEYCQIKAIEKVRIKNKTRL